MGQPTISWTPDQCFDFDHVQVVARADKRSDSQEMNNGTARQ